MLPPILLKYRVHLLTAICIFALVSPDAVTLAQTVTGFPPTGTPMGTTPPGVSPGVGTAGSPPSTGTVGTPPGTTPTTPGTTGSALANPLNNINSFTDLLNAIVNAIIQLGGILLVLALVFTGFKFVQAQGKEEALREARSMLVWTVIGGLILLGAGVIKGVIIATVQGL